MIDDAIQQAISRHELSRGDDLLGFIMDCEAHLEDQRFFSTVEIVETGDPASMICGKIEIAPETHSLQAISGALLAAWQSIAYLDFAASSLRWYEEATVFRFITAVSKKPLAVTGTLVARGPNYSRLVEEFRDSYAGVGELIERYPGSLPR